MKAQRRHELQQNELARMLMESREFFNKYGAYVAGGLLVVVVILVGGAIWRNSYQNRQLEAWNRFAEMRRESGTLLTGTSPADPMNLINRLRNLGSSDQPALRLEALHLAGNVAWQYAVGFDRARDAAEKTALLDTSAEIYEQITREHPKNVSAVGRAQLALATIREEQGRFDDAKKIYDALLADARFADSYVRTRAADSLERLPRISQPIVFAPPPPPPPPVETPLTPTAPTAEPDAAAVPQPDPDATAPAGAPTAAPAETTDQPPSQPRAEPSPPEEPAPAPEPPADESGDGSAPAAAPADADEPDAAAPVPQPDDTADPQ